MKHGDHGDPGDHGKTFLCVVPGLRAVQARARTAWIRFSVVSVVSVVSVFQGFLLPRPAFAQPLPYQAPGQHVGVVNCASSLCHGSVSPWKDAHILQNEYVTWSRVDKHAMDGGDAGAGGELARIACRPWFALALLVRRRWRRPPQRQRGRG